MWSMYVVWQVADRSNRVVRPWHILERMPMHADLVRLAIGAPHMHRYPGRYAIYSIDLSRAGGGVQTVSSRQLALSDDPLTAGENRVGYWLTPPNVMRALDERFRFTFDPCPYPRPPGFDGLKEEWGARNWVNPPFDKCMSGPSASMAAWVRKAIGEKEKGRFSVVIAPVWRWIVRSLLAGARIEVAPEFRWHNRYGNPQPSARPMVLLVFDPHATPCAHCGGTGREQ